METKNLIAKKLENFGILMLTFFISALAFAQENSTPDLKVDVNKTTTTTTEEWFTNPLYWVIGALILIVLIAVVARGNSSKS